MTQQAGLQPRVDASRAYQRARARDGIHLRLDANEGREPSIDAALRALANAGPDALRRYPDTGPFEAQLARHFGIDASQVLVTAGADEGIDRCCRAFLRAGDSMLIADPSFEMFERYARLCDAGVITVPWTPGTLPASAMLERLEERTAIVAVVTPNNPTGEVATLEDVRRLSAAAPRSLIVLDHAYVEFATEDLTLPVLSLPNVVVVRTFSKAWGLAGCRVGYVLGPAAVLLALRAAGGPYPVSAASLIIAQAQFETGRSARDSYVDRIRSERDSLYDLLARRGANPRSSQANFVFAELRERSSTVHASLIARGILVRTIADSSGAPLGLRISLPGDADSFEMLTRALEEALT